MRATYDASDRKMNTSTADFCLEMWPAQKTRIALALTLRSPFQFLYIDNAMSTPSSHSQILYSLCNQTLITPQSCSEGRRKL